MNKTKIEWVKNNDGTQGYTINPVKGLCPMACSYCYARARYKRFKWNPEIRYVGMNNIPEKPCLIFVGSTMELFGDWIKPEWLEYIFEYCRSAPKHIHIFLTKQPQNLIKWSPFPDNCWVGVSATNNYDIINSIGYLGMTKARVKFISIEPLLSWDTFTSEIALKYLSLINWLIIGQRTPVSKKTEPKIGWIKEIVEAADKAGLPVFLKNNLKPLLDYFPNAIWAWEDEPVGINPDYFPEPALRQEFPR